MLRAFFSNGKGRLESNNKGAGKDFSVMCVSDMIRENSERNL